MRKNFKYNIIGLALLLLTIVSCDTATQDVSPIISPDDYPVVTFTLVGGSTTITEGDTIRYDISIDKMLDRPLTFNINMLDANTLDADEYTVFPARIEAFSTTAQLRIVTYQDWLVEGDEVLNFQFVINSLAEKYLVNPSTDFISPSITVKNYTTTSPDLRLEFGWETDIDLGALGVYPTSANVDFDVYYSLLSEFDINDVWASAVADYSGATGNHPEVFTLSGWADGEYVFWFDLWANDFAGYGNTTPIPVTGTALKQGLLNESVVQDPNYVINADTPGYAADGTESNGVIMIVKVVGTTYTIKDYTGATQATGKISGEKTPRPIIK